MRGEREMKRERREVGASEGGREGRREREGSRHPKGIPDGPETQFQPARPGSGPAPGCHGL